MTSPSPRAAPLVLIVDDNQKNLKLARDVLRAAGFRTLEAERGADGMTLAAQHLPDVILMDIRLPDMDGTDAARALGHGARTAQIPVVALSALPLEGDGDWLLAAGFAGYLEKPINVGEFPGPGEPLLRAYPGVIVRRRASTPTKCKRAGLAHGPAPRILKPGM